MPIYEYECSKCGHFEVVQKASAKALKAKPDCQDAKCPCNAKRLISASAFHLKGSGWYKTDYSPSKNNSSESSKGEAKTKVSEKSSDASTKTEASTDKKNSGGGGCGSGCGCH